MSFPDFWLPSTSYIDKYIPGNLLIRQTRICFFASPTSEDFGVTWDVSLYAIVSSLRSLGGGASGKEGKVSSDDSSGGIKNRSKFHDP